MGRSCIVRISGADGGSLKSSVTKLSFVRVFEDWLRTAAVCTTGRDSPGPGPQRVIGDRPQVVDPAGGRFGVELSETRQCASYR
jgi:hypothetical protein